MKKGLVTVVLPIYNVEPYLDRCIQSVVNQTYKNLEILLIDDGSPDNCPKMCDEWAERDERIRVIHKQNQGLGMARNTGIENATGEYICFFDSDDYVAENTVESAFKLAQKEDADIVHFGFNRVDSNGKIVSTFKTRNDPGVFEGEEVLDKFFPDFMAPNPHIKEVRRFYMSSCLLLYSTKMIASANWRFVSERDIISEDVFAMLPLFKYVKKVAILPEALYYYCNNSASLSQGYKPDRYKKVKHFYLESIKLCEELGYSEEIKHRVTKPYVAFTIAALKQECAVKSSFKESLKAVKKVAGDETFQAVLKRNKKDVVSTTRRIMFFLLRNKMFILATLLFKIKK